MGRRRDLTGWRYGRLTVIGVEYRDDKGLTYYRVQCLCGNEKVVEGRALSTGHTKSCGCLSQDTRSGPRVDLTGRFYGRLKVLGPSHSGTGGWWWKCECECGNIKAIRGSNLNTGYTQSCGCLKREQLSDRRRKHGLSQEPEYGVWMAMKQRCTNPDCEEYKWYGARGITVCDRWLGDDGPVNFINDMGPRPSPDHSLERKDNNGNYEPTNCVWTLEEAQKNNMRSNIRIEYRGITRTLAQWCRKLMLSRPNVEYWLKRGMTFAEVVDRLQTIGTREAVCTFEFRGERKTGKDLEQVAGVPSRTIVNRINSRGWSVEDAVTTPSKSQSPPLTVEYQGKTWRIGELAKTIGMTRQGLVERIVDRGMSVEEAVNTPSAKDPNRHVFTIDGVTKTLKEWVSTTELSYATIKQRIDSGWSIEKALNSPLIVGRPR